VGVSYEPKLKFSTPATCKIRRYPIQDREWIRNYIHDLQKKGLVRRNNSSTWCFHVNLTPKSRPQQYRFTVELRQVNSKTEPIVFSMTIAEVHMEHAVGKKIFSVIECDNGYWQIGVAEKAQEIFSIITEDGIWRPTRLLQGTVDGVALFQQTMLRIFHELLFESLLIWMDDLLTYTETWRQQIERLERIFSLCAQNNVKLSAKKSQLFKKMIKWCGKIVSKDGVAIDTDYTEGL
jgi:hypothetical protein